MNILAVYGSPNKHGNTATVTDAILTGLCKKNQVDRVYLYDKVFHDCLACEEAKEFHKEKYCQFDDDFTRELIPLINTADLIIISSPVWFGQITGTLKTFIDRWYTYIEDDFNIRILPGKKFITITSSAAPDDVFKSVSDYLNYWLTTFFKMEQIGSFHFGSMYESGLLKVDSQIVIDATNLGNSL
ncbi:MAG: flavodoxin family protein [Candidatus Cloacimonetes bacterium]|nr:flavodoxin family protein [Candidatus Cloacimonadota bacterium]